MLTGVLGFDQAADGDKVVARPTRIIEAGGKAGSSRVLEEAGLRTAGWTWQAWCCVAAHLEIRALMPEAGSAITPADAH